MNHGFIETIVGFFVVIIAAIFLFFGYTLTSKQPAKGVTYRALFESVEGITVNSEVKIGGVRIGSVTDIAFDNSFQVIITAKVKKDIKIPKDSSIEVKSSGLMGDKFLEIIPGGDFEFLKDGEYFSFTKSSINLESFVNKIISAFVKK
ncbi:MAG: outer membrane lipid asymmetry maintenance protein MlaD [Holosporales bacterium]|jgi:phospholipid/cholesterol/gamma-HCH transport system substrate-binding protein|nr:outer membrane lipid asymmetry maintenance protein MlaD [Holosporales bacterium]